MNTIIKTKLLVIILALCFLGCAGVGKFTPQGAVQATNAVTVASGLLHVLDGFYGDLLNLKLVPGGFTTEATRALSIADAAAAFLKGVIAGNVVATDEQINIAAGQVTGAEAILKTIK